MGLFFLYPNKEFYLLELTRKINLAHTSVKRNLMDLVDNNIIMQKVKKVGSRDFPVYKANTESYSYKKYKKINNFIAINESGLIEFLEQQLMPKSIVLFGSYMRGEDFEDSDIDLFVECESEEIDVSVYEYKLQRKIQIHFRQDFNKYSKELKNNIINGIVLSGFLEGF